MTAQSMLSVDWRNGQVRFWALFATFSQQKEVAADLIPKTSQFVAKL